MDTGTGNTPALTRPSRPARRSMLATDRDDEFILTTRTDSPRSVGVELTIVFLITLGMSGLTSLVSIIETTLRPIRPRSASAPTPLR